MADVVGALRSYLIANGAVNALVGNRVTPVIMPQGSTYPAIVLTKISTRHYHTLSGFAGNASARIQIDCVSDSPDEASDLCEKVRDCGIVGLKGVTNGVDIRGARVDEGERYTYDESRDASDDHRYIVSMDLMIDYTETI